MAYTKTAKSAAETARFNSGSHPLFVGKNVLEDFNYAAEWRASGSWASGTDDTAAGYPTSRLYDGVPGDVSKCDYNVDTSNPGYILLDLKDVEFDFIAILGHNCGDVYTISSGSMFLSLQIADDNAFTSNLETVFRTAPSPFNGYKRYTYGFRMIKADSEYTYSNVRYARIMTEGKYAYTGTVPLEIGQIFLGKYYMPEIPPKFPIQDDFFQALYSDFISDTGKITRYQLQYGIFREACNLYFSNETELALWKQFLFDNIHGVKPFFYSPDPTETDSIHASGTPTSIRAYMMFLDEVGTIIKDQQGTIKTTSFTATENGDHNLDMELRQE